MTSKRSHGEGTVFQEASTGRWIAEISDGYGTNGRRKRIRRKARTKTAALAKLRELRVQVQNGVPAGRANMTVAEVLEFFVETVVRSTDPSPNTIDNYRWAIDGHLKPCLGRIRITALTPEEVERFLVERRDTRDLAKNSLIRLKMVLSSGLKEAERRDWLHRNVAAIARVPPSHTTERRSLTPAQATELLKAAAGNRLEAAIYVGLSRGLRPGEILGLRWSDVDLNASPPTLRIRHSLKRENGQLRLGSPKTPNSRRSLVLPPIAVDKLRRHRSVQAKERLHMGEDWIDLDLVFCTQVGTLIDPSNFRREFKKMTRAAGLGDWTPYEMRHSAISLLSAAGVPVEKLSDLAGHTGTRTLTHVYRHQVSPAVDAGAEVADEIFKLG